MYNRRMASLVRKPPQIGGWCQSCGQKWSRPGGHTPILNMELNFSPRAFDWSKLAAVVRNGRKNSTWLVGCFGRLGCQS